MREAGRSHPRFPAATAFVASAALLAAAAHPAFGQGRPSDDRAMAVPRISVTPDAAGGVPLPQPLAPSEAARLRHIFALQSRGAMDAASRETDQLDMTSLLGAAMVGHILADRYLGRFTHPHADELQAWIARYEDLPDAADIHALMLVRLPQAARSRSLALLPASSGTLPAATTAAVSQPPVPEETEPPSSSVSRNPGLDRDVADTARRRGAAGVTRLLARTEGLSPSYASILQGEAARILFTLGHDEEALAIGTAGAHACWRQAPEGCRTHALGGYEAGLAAWRLGRIELSASLFERAWRAPLGTSSLRAAAALWAARAHLASGDSASFAPWLGRASVEAYTFHGQIARRMLGLASGTAPGERGHGASGDGRETLGEADVEAIAALPGGLRAFALLQIGQRERAEAELRLLWPTIRNTPPLVRAVMLVAERAGLPELAAQLADLLQAEDGRPREATRFRVPRLRPDGGFRVDPALVYALARTESNFDTTMVSSAGARGILQIRPETASFVTAGGARDEDGSRAARLSQLLHDPAVNLDLGQRYVTYLSNHAAVAGDLIRLLVGYNAGPGNLQRWAPGILDLGDPLLFIEAIPADETRAFVPRVLSYTWIFADRLHLPTPSLDDLARGAWPRFHPLGEQLAQAVH